MVTEAATVPQEKPPSFPVFKNREELSGYARKLGFKKIEEFESALGSVQQREKLVEALRKRDPKLNGQVDALITHLKLNHQEIARKERWYEKALKLPGRALKATWETMKKHPALTILVLAALVAGGTAYGLYLTGNLEFVATKLGLGKMFGAVDAAGEMMPPVPPTPPVPGLGELGVPPPAAPIPGAGGPI